MNTMKLNHWQSYSIGILTIVAFLFIPLNTIGADESAGDHSEVTKEVHAPATDEVHQEHEAHVPHNLAHANPSPQLNKAEEFKKEIAIYTLILFVLMVIVLRIFAWKPIISGLDAREQKIIDHIDKARQSADQAQQRMEQYEARLASAAQEANEIVAEGRRDAEATRDRIVAEAGDAAKAERDRAINEIALAKHAALQPVAEQSADIAVSLAGKIVRRELNTEDHASLIQESLDSLQEN